MAKAQLGQDWELIGNDGGDLVFRNKDTGNEQRIDKSAALDVDSITTEQEGLKTVWVSTDNFAGSDTHEAFNNARSEYGLSNIEYIVDYQDNETLRTAMDLTDKPAGDPVRITLLGETRFTAGDPIAFDITNSHNSLYIDGSDFRLRGVSDDSTPDVGFFISRDDTDVSSGINALWGWPQINGEWNSSAIYNVGGETWKFAFRAYNELSSGTAAAMQLSNNINNVPSVYSTATTSDVVCTQNTYYSCDFRGGPSDHGFYFEPTRNLRVLYPFISGGTEDFIHIDASNRGGDGPHIFKDPRGEQGNSNPDYVIGSTGPGSGSNPVSRFVMQDGQFSEAVTSFARFESGVNPFNLQLGGAGGNLNTNADGVVFADDGAMQPSVLSESVGPITTPNGGIISSFVYWGDRSNIPIGSNTRESLAINLTDGYITAFRTEDKIQWDISGDVIVRGTVTENATDGDFGP